MFLDCQRTFDNVAHKMLIKILEHQADTREELHWIENYPNAREQKTRVRRLLELGKSDNWGPRELSLRTIIIPGSYQGLASTTEKMRDHVDDEDIIREVISLQDCENHQRKT